jgi:hypothetical protein
VREYISFVKKSKSFSNYAKAFLFSMSSKLVGNNQFSLIYFQTKSLNSKIKVFLFQNLFA